MSSLFSFYYFILFGLCILILTRMRTRSTRVYFTLLLTLFSQAISTIISIPTTLIKDGESFPPTYSSSSSPSIAITALNDFFSYSAYLLLFLCITLLLRDRHLAVQPLSIAIPTRYYALFGFLGILGITTIGFYNDLVRPIFSTSNDNTSLWFNLAHSFNSFYYFASACLVGYSIYVYKEIQRLSLYDMVCSFLFSNYRVNRRNAALGHAVSRLIYHPPLHYPIYHEYAIPH